MLTLLSSFGLGNDRAQALLNIGPRLDPEMMASTRAIFEGTWDPSMPDGGSIVRDIPYGEHARHRLDIYSPSSLNNPVLLFVHGGGFVAGDKSVNSYVGPFFARAGFVTVVMNYRLAPDHPWPAGGQDVSAALDWIFDHIAEFGGNPEKIFFVGQSAGGVHGATALLDQRFQPRCLPAVRAALLMSGLFEMKETIQVPGVVSYFGEDSAKYPDRSPINHAGGMKTQIILTIAELDPAFIVPSILDMAKALSAQRGEANALTWLKGHNHLSPALAIGARGDQFGAAVAAAFHSIEVNAVFLVNK